MRQNESGIALITVLLLTALVSVLLSAHFLIARAGLASTKSMMDANRGFYAAEAGLNLRAEAVRNKFLGYNRPSGAPPSPVPGQTPCKSGSLGSGDFACTTYAILRRDVVTWIREDPSNPTSIVVPPGEVFQSLTAQEYLYIANAVAIDKAGHVEAKLEMQFRSRLIPLFQFAAFYNKDLEILPGPPMTLGGPVHTNGNLFLNSNSSLIIDGQITTAGKLFRGRKNDNSCGGTVSVHDLAGPKATPACGSRYELLQDDVNGVNDPAQDWQGLIRVGTDVVTVPPIEDLDPVPGSTLWDIADLRILYDVTDGSTPIKVYRADGTLDVTNTSDLAANCPAAASVTSGSMHNYRENVDMKLLEIDIQELMDCVELGIPALMGGRALSDSTEGGLVWYFGVEDGVNAEAPNDYGVRIHGGAVLGPSSGSTSIQGLTVVTNQALYVQGDFNVDNGADWRPAAFLADSLNVLSNNWSDANSNSGLGSRIATATTVRAAFLAGTDSTGDSGTPPTGGEGGLNNGNYNGGLENYPRFHEDWGGVTLTYRGSFVSLNRARRVDGPWGNQSYHPPNRDWGFESRFSDAANLPPATPRFVYLKQDLFLRDYAN